MIRALIPLLFPLMLYAQSAPSLVPAECNGGTITRTESYRGRALAGYMDGGAELFHEYGFVALSVQDVAIGGEALVTVEVFRMASPLAAFGIFSVSRQGCAEGDSSFMCASPYQVQGIAGECYIRVQSGTNTPAASAARLGLFRNLVRRLGQGSFTLSPFFGSPRGVILMSGPLGVQNGMPELEEILEGAEGYAIQAVWLHSPGKEDDLIAEIALRSEGAADAFVRQWGGTPDGNGAVAIPAHAGWWMVRQPGATVRAMRGSANRERATALLTGPVVHGQ